MRRAAVVVALAALLLPACGGNDAADGEEAGSVRIVDVDAGEGGRGEEVVLENTLDIRNDVGGWYLTVAGTRIPLGVGRQIPPGARLVVRTGAGESGDDVVHAGLDGDVLADDGGVVRLFDAAGSEVHRFAYGDAR